MGNQNCFDYEAKPRDPITLGSLDKHKFIFFRQLPGGDYVHVEYNLSSLIDYFLKSGDFVEPESRIEFTDEDLLRLDLQVRHFSKLKLWIETLDLLTSEGGIVAFLHCTSVPFSAF